MQCIIFLLFIGYADAQKHIMPVGNQCQSRQAHWITGHIFLSSSVSPRRRWSRLSVLQSFNSVRLSKEQPAGGFFFLFEQKKISQRDLYWASSSRNMRGLGRNEKASRTDLETAKSSFEVILAQPHFLGRRFCYYHHLSSAQLSSVRVACTSY